MSGAVHWSGNTGLTEADKVCVCAEEVCNNDNVVATLVRDCALYKFSRQQIDLAKEAERHCDPTLDKLGPVR